MPLIQQSDISIIVSVAFRSLSLLTSLAVIAKSAVNTGYLAIAGFLIAKATRQDIVLTRSSNESVSSAEPAIGILASLPSAFLLTSFLPSAMPSKGLPDSLVVSSLGLLALSHFFVLPMVSESASRRIATIKAFKWQWPVAVTTAAFIASTAFERMLHVADFAVALIAYFCTRSSAAVLTKLTLRLQHIRTSSTRILAWQQMHSALRQSFTLSLINATQVHFKASRNRSETQEQRSRLSCKILTAGRFTISSA